MPPDLRRDLQPDIEAVAEQVFTDGIVNVLEQPEFAGGAFCCVTPSMRLIALSISSLRQMRARSLACFCIVAGPSPTPDAL